MDLLLVEDDADYADTLRSELTALDHRVVVAPTGPAALVEVERDRFDAVILDRMLPHLDGASVVRRLRDNGHRLPVLMLFWSHELWQFYLFAVIFGIGYGGEGSAFPIINRQYFGRGPMGRSFGWQQAGAGAGMATGAWVGALLYGFFGAYDATIVLSTVASVVGALVLLSMEPTSRLLIPSWEDSVTTQTSRPQPA